MNNNSPFLIGLTVGACLAVMLLVILMVRTIKSLPKLKNDQFIFHISGASGYSCKSFITKAGGATGVLRVSISENNLHLWASPIFALFGKLYDLIHEIPLNQIEKVEQDGKKTTLTFRKNGASKQFVIRSMKNQNEFLEILDKHIVKI